MISRDWQCLNQQCGHVFHSFDHANPPCPICDCYRVSWVPAGCHPQGLARRVDARLQNIADQHGMTNLNSASPSRLNRAAPRIDVPAVTPELGIKSFGPGFSAPIAYGGPICVPSVAPVNLTGRIPVGPNVQRMSPSSSVPGPSANAVMMGRTLQRTVK